MNEFISNLELREETKDLKELKNHFTNNYNKTKKTNGFYKQEFDPTKVKIVLR